MRAKLTNPLTLLVFLCVVSAFTLGGAPPSDGNEGHLDSAYAEPAVSRSSSLSLHTMAASLVPVPLHIQLLNIGTNSKENGKALFHRIGATERSLSKVVKPVVAAAPKATTTVVKNPAPVAKKPYLTHTVRNGETISDIARKYGISVDTLVNVNMLGSIHKLKVGQKLNVVTVNGLLYTVKQGESLWDIARRYKVDVQKIVAVNRLGSPDRLKPRQMIVLPGAKPIQQPQVVKSTRSTSSTKKSTTTTRSASTSVVSSRGRLQRGFQWPVRGRITSRFGSRWGRMHEGIDIGLRSGTPVRAAASGRVTFAGWGGAYGYLVKIDHGHGVETRYAHNSRLLVRVGQTISKGQLVSRSGNTGRSTGPHLHFEIRLNGRPYNPLSYVR